MQVISLDLEFLSWVRSVRSDFSEMTVVKAGISTVCMVNWQPQACLLVGAFALFPTSCNCLFSAHAALFQFHVAWFHVPLVSLRAQALNKPQTLE